MFFYASKTLGFFTQPSNFLIVIGIVGFVLLLLKRYRFGTSLVGFSGLMLAIVGFSPLCNILLLSLSERFPRWQDDGRTPDGIIVLGGTIDADASVVRNSLEMNSAGERITAMLELAQRFPQAKIVFSGGSSSMIETTMSEAPVAGDVLKRFGVDPARIVLENDSRTTDENAVFSARMLQPKPGQRWLLVTSSWHMPRSIGVFRKAGFADIEAYPVDWRTRGWIDATETSDTASFGIARADLAMHEWVGLISYRLAGRTSELLPGPTKP